MREVKGVIANVDDGETVWTDEAVASLVGQTPKFTIDGRFDKVVSRAKVVAAERRDNDIVVTYEVPDETYEKVTDMLGPSGDGEPHTGIGYYVDGEKWSTGEESKRTIERLRLMTVSRASYPPARAPVLHHPTKGRMTLDD
jgi:hypothetical protein